MAMERGMIMVCVVATLLSVASAIPGTATFYTVYVPSACYGFQDQGTMIAAAGDALWNNGAACGRTYRVRCTSGTNATPNPCTGNSVTVRIVDRCPSAGCILDLSQEAFSVIGNLDAGRINIDYVQV